MLSNPNLIFAYKTAHEIKDLIYSLNFELRNNSYIAQAQDDGGTLIVNEFVEYGQDAVHYLNDLIYELEKLNRKAP